MARASAVEILAVFAVGSLVSLPASAQEPDLEAMGEVACKFGSDLMAGAVLKGVESQPVDEGKDALAELPTIEDDGK